MPNLHPIYRLLIRLYPKDFRTHYGEDLVQNFADLIADRGTRAAWARTGIDLVVTVPRYRLENLMTERRGATALLYTIILLVAVGGVLAVFVGIPLGLILVPVALILAIAQRSNLARAIRTSDPSRRRRRLMIAAILGAVFAVSAVSWIQAIADEHISEASLVAHNAIGILALVGSIVFLVVGLLTRKSPANRPMPPTPAG